MTPAGHVVIWVVSAKMKIRALGLISVAGLAFVLVTSLQAQVIPGRWEKVDSLQPGQQIIVNLKRGERIEGEFDSSSVDHLSIRADQHTLDVPKLEVSKIVLVEDPLLNGTVTGLLWGLAGGLAMGGAIAGAEPDFVTWFPITLFGGIGAATGAFIGRAVDKSRKEVEIVYQAL